jgi:hypothetical protein
MTANVRAYIEAITRLRDTGRPVLLPVETEKTGKGKEAK